MVPFDACLARFAADETVEDWFSTATGAKGAATRRSRFATFPEVLPVQVRRYYVASDWTPKKLDALVPMPETIDLGALRGVGLQPGETELPEAADAAAAAVPEIPTDAPAVPAELESAFEPDPDIVAQLVGMGFSENGSRRAAGATRNAGAEPAMEWVFAHMEDPDFNDPYVPATGAALTGNSGAMPSPGGGSAVADASAVAMLAAMGFAEKHAAAGWNAPGGDVERAADWLFSNADDLESAVAEAEAQSGRGAGRRRGRRVDPLRPRVPRRVPVRGRARDLRAFRGRVAHWREHGVRPLRRARQVAGRVVHLQRRTRRAVA